MIERKAELHCLEQLYEQSGNQILVLYGRKDNQGRQLVQKFCREKRAFYYYAPEVSAKAQKDRMGREIADYYQISVSDEKYDTYFKRIRSGDGSKLVLVIEEFQNILKKDKQFLDSLIKLRDKKLYPGPVMVLLCSSDVSWVEQELPELFGNMSRKLRGMMKLGELRFMELAKCFPDYNFRQNVEIYGIVGGVPEFLRHWDPNENQKVNICRNILSPDGYFHNKAEELIRSQLRELSVYHTILEAMASGKRKLNELYQETGFSRAKIDRKSVV